MRIQDGSLSCLNDFIRIYDGPSASSPFMRRLCGFFVPNDLIGTSSSMFIRFQTNGGTTFQGYQINYSNVGKKHTVDRGTVRVFYSVWEGRS